MYLNSNKNPNYWILDIEANSLTPDVIWCVVLRNCSTGEVLDFLNKESFLSWLDEHQSSFFFVGHNILSYDIPWLNKLWGTDISYDRCVDTLTLSLLYNPALVGGHSLEAWGHRLKFPKQEYNDWSKFTEEMLKYCRNDCELTYRVFVALTNKMYKMGYSEKSCEIEHKIRVIINEQQEHGFWFDKERAKSLRDELRERQSHLTEQIQELFPPTLTLVNECSFRRNKDGSLPLRIKKAISRYHSVVVDEVTGIYKCYSLIEFNIGSPKQRVERLLELGWEPKKFTSKGFPQVDEDALVRFQEGLQEQKDERSKVVGAIAEWLVLQGRSSMIETWLNNLGPDSRIHGRVNSCGATTRRLTHFSPNSANIPSGAKAKYGHECRALWGVEPDRGLILVGADASGLENVGLLHYLNNKEAEKLLAQKKPNDVHTLNARRLTEALGKEIDREWGSKTSFYAALYGAYPPKLASIVKGTKKEGEIVQEIILSSIPGLPNLIKEIQYEWKSNRGRLVTIDGGYVQCPSSSASLNYKIQSLGACVMKLAAILLYEEATKQGLWFKFVGNIHDEFQMETLEEDGDRLGKLAVWSMEEAARQLKFNLPLSGEYKLGQSWDDTH